MHKYYSDSVEDQGDAKGPGPLSPQSWGLKLYSKLDFLH